MYKIDYDHETKRLDVFGILDISGDQEGREERFASALSRLIHAIFPQIEKIAIDSSQVDLYGNGVMWVKIQDHRFEEEYSPSQITLDFDKRYIFTLIMICKDGIYTTDAERLSDVDYGDTHPQDDHIALRFTLKVDRMHHKYDVMLLAEDRHVEGTL